MAAGTKASPPEPRPSLHTIPGPGLGGQNQQRYANVLQIVSPCPKVETGGVTFGESRRCVNNVSRARRGCCRCRRCHGRIRSEPEGKMRISVRSFSGVAEPRHRFQHQCSLPLNLPLKRLRGIFIGSLSEPGRGAEHN